MEIISSSTAQEALAAAGDKLAAVLAAAAQKPMLVLLSGGSALALASYIPDEVLSNSVTIGVLDERFSTDETVNNFLQLQTTSLYEKALAAGCVFLSSVPEEGEALEVMAMRITTALQKWAALHPQGSIVVTQGIGSDGHTAGVMPYPEDVDFFYKTFDDPDAWVVGYDAGDKNTHPQRVTVTLSFLRSMVTTSVVYAVGSDKHDVLTRLSDDESLAVMPAQIVKQMREVFVFTDSTDD